MECMEAQEVISSALDREPVTEEVLADAKEHCHSCAQCSRMVKALVAVKRSPLPEPSEDLPDRIMAAVRADSALSSGSPVPQAAPDDSAQTSPTDRDAPASVVPLPTLRERLLHPRNRRALAAWSAAAAVIFVAAGIGAIGGLRTIIIAPTPIGMTADSPATFNSEETAPEPPSAQEAAILASGLIVVDTAAYRFVGPDDSVSATALKEIGRTRSDLGETFVTEHRVLSAGDPARVFIARTDGEVLAFDRVIRSYQGLTYVLRSDAISSFKELATLPDGMSEPVSADGSPLFEPVRGGGESGIYLKAGADAATGIALPPGSDPSLSAGWTWWTPAR